MTSESRQREIAIAFTSDELDAIYHAIENAPSDAGREQAYESVIDKIVPPHPPLKAESERLRRDVRTVIREWQDYPATYPRAAFIEDLRGALDAERTRA